MATGFDEAARAANDAVLSDRSRAVLEFERHWSERSGGKSEAIREAFGVSPARYYQLLSAVLASPQALRHDPLLVRRLLEARARRRGDRDARRDPRR
ncbi:DUF3263 domain-containing protein [Mycetocola reblochoni]|uniref:DUF3263 domain-containing protein n=2 Tax=Mycetocola reblochoni TaxID=331618 RepID=A0A1R4KDU6_9MICO|nr:DUF3263 domain-containing protein [Mycetocola reblochoni]RLP68400.1 DUF3263 domain-containing protein [Mycetocola reblochoni]SJN42466.1 hypothetical protein FM119_13280 [Mycetocola reblochoni REB411]